MTNFMLMHKYRFILLLFISWALCLHVSAQDISIMDFRLDEMDLSANGRNALLDQNGDKCALIRVQTPVKGLTFDVGSLGVMSIDPEHVGETWVWVPSGIKHITIYHNQLSPSNKYDFPISIESARTYVMRITTAQVFTNNYDDKHKQTLYIEVNPSHSHFLLNGMTLTLNAQGKVEQELSFGTYTYKVECDGYYPKEGQITINDPKNKQRLIINDLEPITGKLIIYTEPVTAIVSIDGIKSTASPSSPATLQIGKHVVTVKAIGYKEESRVVYIEKDQITDESVSLTQSATYAISSKPNGATVTINKRQEGITPFTAVLTTGSYMIKATKAGYKDYYKNVSLTSSDPYLEIPLKKIFNYKNEFYVEAGALIGSFYAAGVTVGLFLNNINAEFSLLAGLGESDPIYWSGINVEPKSGTYTPKENVSGKIGYGFPVGTRARFTPQLGANFLKLKETMSNSSSINPADGAYVLSALASVRMSMALASQFEVSLSPEYLFAVSKSKGYDMLSAVSSQIKGWGEGFSIKLGLALFF